MHLLIATLLPLIDETPAPADVKAGWVAFVVFAAMALGVFLIGYFLSRSLKRSRATDSAGGYDESDHQVRGSAD